MAEDYLGGFTSIYLQKRRLSLRRGYGVYATSNRIFLVKGWVGSLIGLLGVIVLALAVLATILEGGPNSQIPLIQPLFLLVSPIGVVIAAVLFPFLIEEKLKRQGPKSIGELERKRDFEISRGEIHNVEVKRPGDFGTGYLLIRLKTGEPVKVRIFSSFGGGGSWHLRMLDLMQAFCGKPPVIQTVDLVVWTL